MVVRALYVDRPMKPALPLGDVIRNVGEKIGVRAVTLPHDAILVVAKQARLEPQRAVGFVSHVFCIERLHNFLDPAVGVQRRLEIVRIELHAKCLEIEVLLLSQRGNCELANCVCICRRIRLFLSVRFCITLGDFTDVFTVISSFGNHRFAPGQRTHTSNYACGEILDLNAGIVVVEFTRHVPAGPLQQRRDSVAQRRLTAMAYVKRASGVGRHKFDVDRLPFADI